MSLDANPKPFSHFGWIFKAWMGILLLAVAGKSSIVVREKCLSHSALSEHACSASNPSVSALDSNPNPIQMSCHCSEAACGNYAVPKVMQSCRSGFVHANKCGACVRCAKDLDEACGGFADYVGSCRQGLVCEIPEPDGKDDHGGEGKCVVDAPEQRKKGKVYRSPKATFPIKDLADTCRNNASVPAAKSNGKKEEGENPEKAKPETEKAKQEVTIQVEKLEKPESEKVKPEVTKQEEGEKPETEKAKPEAKKGLRSSLPNKLSSVERGWREIFEDKDLEKTGSEVQEDFIFPVSNEQVHLPVAPPKIPAVPPIFPAFPVHRPVFPVQRGSFPVVPNVIPAVKPTVFFAPLPWGR
jgi:hypothetical protein